MIFENSVNLQPKSSLQCILKTKGRDLSVVHAQSIIQEVSAFGSTSANNATSSETRKGQTKDSQRCYDCKGLGHYER